jgi:hypothetical protein
VPLLRCRGRHAASGLQFNESQQLHRREPLVTAAGDPVVTGVLDFEPASFDDSWLTSPKRFALPHSALPHSVSQATPAS